MVINRLAHENSSIQTEVDTSYLYQKLTDNEEDKTIAKIFRQMSEIERSHTEVFAAKKNIDLDELMRPHGGQRP